VTIRKKRVLLCLDYDGTISEIVQDPGVARPMPGVLEVLAEFAARRDQIAVAIVSGREVATLREILHTPRGIALSGIHGLELVDFEGSEEIMQGARECTNDLEKVHGRCLHRTARHHGLEAEPSSSIWHRFGGSSIT
jgi:trehalose-phosphatase